MNNAVRMVVEIAKRCVARYDWFMPQPTQPTRPQQTPNPHSSRTADPKNSGRVSRARTGYDDDPELLGGPASRAGAGAPNAGSTRGGVSASAAQKIEQEIDEEPDDVESCGAGHLLGGHADRSTDTEFFSPVPDGYQRGRTKYVAVFGTVMSGLGKGDLCLQRGQAAQGQGAGGYQADQA